MNSSTDDRQELGRSISEQSYPLSFGQEALWFQSLLRPHSPAYNIAGSFEMEGELDFAALQEALGLLIARHETLRTTICMEDGRAVQKVSPEPNFTLPLLDLSVSDAATKDEVLAGLSDAALRTVFSLQEGPLIKLSLIRLAPKRHVIFLAIHHIVADGWSIIVFKRELSLFYNAVKAGIPSPLLPLPMQYGQYAQWQRDHFRGDQSQVHLAYWRKTLAGAPAALNLRPDFSRQKGISDAGATIRCVIEPTLTRTLKAYCKIQRISLFSALLTGFAMLLHQLSGDHDIVVGTAVTNRHRKELQDLIGYFINMLPLRLFVNPGHSGDDLAKQVSSVVLTALAHQAAPFEAIVQQQRYVRVNGGHPLFQTALVLNHPSKAPFALSEISATDRPSPASTTKFDLSLNLTEVKDDWIVGDLEYRTEIFARTSAERMVDQLTALWRGLAVQGEQPIAALCRLLEEEIGIAFPSGPASVNSRLESCLHLQFESQVKRTPTKMAITGTSSSLSYCELNAAANRLAQVLRQRGVGREDVVGIALRRDLNYVISTMAVLKAGAVCLPLDLAAPQARNEELIARSSARIAITESKAAADFRVPVLILDSQPVNNELLAASPEDCSHDLLDDTSGNGLAYILFTSGSTGHPKGVQLTHRGLTGIVLGQEYLPFDPDTTTLQHSPVTFDASAFELWIGLLSGGSCVLSPHPWLTPATLKVLVQQHKITTAFFVPPLFNAFLDEDPLCLSGMRELVLGGEAPSLPYLRRVRRLYPQLRIVNGYGPAEAAAISCAHVVPEDLASENTIPIGRPLANTYVHILSPSLDLCATGVVGEIYLGGPRLARGYLAEPRMTAERFLPNPFEGPGTRMYQTGDFAFRRSDGLLEFVGREDRQIKLNGFRVELSEIEAALLQCEQVRDVIVLLHSLATGAKRLVAFVLSDISAEESREPLLAHLRSHLPHYMVPSQILVRKDWPTNAHNKVDRAALLASIPSPESSKSTTPLCFTATEELIHDIWCRVLKLDAIGREDNFFEIGGNSILAIHIVAQCAAANLELSLGDLFECQEISSLAAVADRHRPAAQMDFCSGSPASATHHGKSFRLPLVTLQPKGTRRPLFFAHPSPGSSFCYMALANALGVERPVFGFQAMGFSDPVRIGQTIEEMASCYIDALQQVQATGPYFLGGHSLGAIIAFEMAQQLSSRNEEVGCLLLLDCVAPVFDYELEQGFFDDDEHSLLLSAIQTLERFTGTAFHLSETLIRSVPISQSYSLLYHKLREIRFISSASDITYIKRLLSISRASFDAIKSYKPVTWTGKGAVLFRAAGPAVDDFPGPIRSALDHPCYRWNELLTHAPDTITIPGDHITMLTAPHVLHLASSIALRLAEADTVQ